MELNRLARTVYTYILPSAPRQCLEQALKGPFQRIYKKKKFIFIHIPKTAGKSVCHLIGVSGARHLTLSQYETYLGRETLEQFYKFTVVRHPLDRLQSAWHYMHSGGNQSKEDHEFRDRWIMPLETFDRFVLDALESEEVAKLGKFRPQVDFLKWQDGTISSSVTLCYFESLTADLSRLPKEILVSEKLPHKNPSKRSDNKISDAAKQRIKSFYREDFSTFEYDDSF